MDREALNQRCVQLIRHPSVKKRMWNPRMFWETGARQLTPRDALLNNPKVDLNELEFMLATAANQPSQCADKLPAERAGFIRRQVRGGSRPLLTRA